jgi:hypothetical protein
MGSALSGAQIRMYGGGDGTIDTIRGLFTQGFGIGEVLEGLAQSPPKGCVSASTPTAFAACLADHTMEAR